MLSSIQPLFEVHLSRGLVNGRSSAVMCRWPKDLEDYVSKVPMARNMDLVWFSEVLLLAETHFW